jgi:predicted type IV restriction endonuclease
MSEPYPKSVDSVVRNLRNRILRIRQRGEVIGEQDTIRVFITPLLTALEWDIEDLDEVKNEYRHRSQDSPVDYALFMLRSPCLFVEAKSLNASIEDRRWVTQTLGYAVASGVEWCVLTNGDEYRLYNAHAPVEVDEKLFRAVKLSDESSHELTVETLDLLSKNKMSEKRLNVLWKAHFVDRRIKSALHELIKKQNDGLVRVLRKVTSKSLTISDIKNSLKRADITVSFPFLVSDIDRPVLPPIIKGKERMKSRSTKETGTKVGASPKVYGVEVRDLIDANIINTPFAIEVKFKKQDFSASIQTDGSILFQGKRYESLSVAAGMARNIASGPPPGGRKHWQTNGWTFWKYRDFATGKPQNIDVLRQQYLKSRSGPASDDHRMRKEEA